MSEVTYKLVLKGYGSNNKGKYYIEQDLADVLAMERKEVKTLLETCPQTIKEGLSKAEGEKLLAAIEAAGAKCDLDDSRFDFSNLSFE